MSSVSIKPKFNIITENKNDIGIQEELNQKINQLKQDLKSSENVFGKLSELDEGRQVGPLNTRELFRDYKEKQKKEKANSPLGKQQKTTNAKIYKRIQDAQKSEENTLHFGKQYNTLSAIRSNKESQLAELQKKLEKTDQSVRRLSDELPPIYPIEELTQRKGKLQEKAQVLEGLLKKLSEEKEMATEYKITHELLNDVNSELEKTGNKLKELSLQSADSNSGLIRSSGFSLD